MGGPVCLNLMKDKNDLEIVDEMEPEDADDSGLDSESELESEGSDESEDSDAYVYGDDELYEKPPKKGQASAEEPKLKKRKKSDTSENPLLVEMGDGGPNNEAVSTVKKAKQWYQKDVFKDVEDDDVDM